jgi:hypothetical protein
MNIEMEIAETHRAVWWDLIGNSADTVDSSIFGSVCMNIDALVWGTVRDSVRHNIESGIKEYEY